MARHTPGPLQASAGIVLKTEYIGHARAVIAHCLETEGDYPESAEIAHANALLYAASPELLEIAELLVQDYERAPNTTGMYMHILELARTALAKVRGEV